jgi:4-carboxymuconolactone decarboxylase
LSGLPTSFSDTRKQAVYDMPREFALGRKGLYDRAVAARGHVGITDVICLMGFYTSVSMTLAFYDVPAGATGMARRATWLGGRHPVGVVYDNCRRAL